MHSAFQYSYCASWNVYAFEMEEAPLDCFPTEWMLFCFHQKGELNSLHYLGAYQHDHVALAPLLQYQLKTLLVVLYNHLDIARMDLLRFFICIHKEHCDDSDLGIVLILP